MVTTETVGIVDATICGMNRVRVSTTVDATQLNRARDLGFARDSELLDAALVALLELDEAQRERRAYADHPGGMDPELDLGVTTIDWDREVPYDGDIPAAVVDLATQRRSVR